MARAISLESLVISHKRARFSGSNTALSTIEGRSDSTYPYAMKKTFPARARTLKDSMFFMAKLARQKNTPSMPSTFPRSMVMAVNLRVGTFGTVEQFRSAG